jgi:DeoR family fructose operon transcriptional repressor
MKGTHRRTGILRLLKDGVSDAEGLSAALDVSVSTIRRDLARMAEEGLLLRTYGGATPLGGTTPERSLLQRAGEKVAEKAAIARCALSLIEPGEALILDAGTTTGALARLLSERTPLRVVTNGLTVIQVLTGVEGIELVALGGSFRAVSSSFVGPHAEATMRRITAERVFLGADGIVAGRGICEATDAQAYLKSLMAVQGEEVYVLATADKLGRAASHAWTELARPWTLITDAAATEAQLAPFRREGVKVLVA